MNVKNVRVNRGRYRHGGFRKNRAVNGNRKVRLGAWSTADVPRKFNFVDAAFYVERPSTALPERIATGALHNLIEQDAFAGLNRLGCRIRQNDHLCPFLFRLATAATAVVRTSIVAAERILNNVCGGRARAQLVHEILVLVGLRLREVKSLNLLLKLLNALVLILHAVLDDLVMKSTVISVLAVDNVAHTRLEGITEIAESLRHVVINAVNGALRIAAALLNLGAKVAEIALKLVSKLRNALIRSVSLLQSAIAGLCKSIVNGIETLVGGVLIEAALNVTDGCTCGITSTTAATEAEAATAPAEEREQDNENPPAVPISPPIAITVHIGNDWHRWCHARTKHFFILSVGLITHGALRFARFSVCF